jgi:hypothetical protein
MTRRRSFQNGCLIKRNGKWVIRWRERVPTDDGQLRRKHKGETLGLVRTMTDYVFTARNGKPTNLSYWVGGS